MENLVAMVVLVVLFAIAAYGLWWVCTKFAMPAPVMWICGAVLIIIILVYLLEKAGLYAVHR